MGLEMTNIQSFLRSIHRGAFIKGQRYFAEIHLSRGVLIPINRENRGITLSANFIDVQGQVDPGIIASDNWASRQKA